MLRLYDSRLSGNAWKVRILMNQLGVPFERITLDLAKGAAKEPAFVRKSRFRRVPVLELEDGRTLVESGAIMLYLARGSRFLPDDPYLYADTVSWLFFEQADLTRALGYPRFFHLRGITAQMSAKITEYQEIGYAGLEKLAQWLEGRTWLVGDDYTIADLAVFPYIALAPEGGYELDSFPPIVTWLARIQSQPGWTPLIEEQVTA